MTFNLKIIVILFLYLGCVFMTSCDKSVDLHFKDPYTISVTGSNYIWHVVYPGVDQVLNTKDDIEGNLPIYLPSKSNVNILLTSKDYLYFFELEDFGQTGIAVPDQSHSVNIETPRSGTYEIKGNQMCGYTHQSLFGDIEILSRIKFKQWQLDNL